MKLKFGILLLVLAAFIAISTGAAHLSCIYFGPQCYAAQMAPEVIVDSAVNGTYLAPIGTMLASGIFIVLGLYALAAAGFTGKVLDKLPLVNYAIYTIATLSIIRGILPLQFWLRHPNNVSDIVVYVGIVWLITGLFYLFGYQICSNKSLTK